MTLNRIKVFMEKNFILRKISILLKKWGIVSKLHGLVEVLHIKEDAEKKECFANFYKVHYFTSFAIVSPYCT